MEKNKRESEQEFYYRTPTKEDVIKFDNVPVEIAAKFLGVSKGYVMFGLQQRTLPIGSAVKKTNWLYHISPGMLVAYKEGTQQITVNIYKPEQAPA